MMLPVYAGIFCILCQWLAPWISFPALRRFQLPAAYRLSEMEQFIKNLQLFMRSSPDTVPLTNAETAYLTALLSILQAAAILSAGLLAVCCICIMIRKSQSKKTVYAAFSFQLFVALVQCGSLFLGNLWMNARTGRPNHFFNLSIHSCIQLTSWDCGQILICIIILLSAHRLLSLQESGPIVFTRPSGEATRRLGRRTLLSFFLIIAAIPLVILFGIYFLNDRSIVFIGLCIIGLAMLPFAIMFEGRRPQARELLLIAVMSGIAVTGRMAFFMLPQFKPTTAVIIITGIGLGAEAGFLTGAISGFVSNFFFGQGPWTPWQMFAYGIIGFLAGVLFHRNSRILKSHNRLRLAAECFYGAFSTLAIYGLLLDVSSVVNFASGLSWQLLCAKMISGLPFNLIHALSTVLFLCLLSEPIEKKLKRIKKKYGILA